MKVTILGLFAVIAVAHASVVQLLPSSTLVRTPALDSAIIQSERLNGAFSYSTVENHAYAPVVQTVNCAIKLFPEYSFYYFGSFQVPFVRTYSYVPQYPQYPQYPQVYYAHQPAVYSFHPSFIPTYSGIPLPAPGAAGVNPQNPVEVEDPADNRPNDDLTQGSNDDEDTVSVESA